MILADTSAWIEYLRGRLPQFGGALANGDIYAHPWVNAELALGNIKDRAIRLGALDRLEQAAVASIDEIRRLVERHQLAGRGVGLVDTQLIASARLTRCGLWTLDRRQQEAAHDVGVIVIGAS
jgi:predicted nucleic acid-binding protein